MTAKEAIKELQVGYLGDTEDLVQAKHIAIKALEKQIPKKPIKEFDDEVEECWLSCPTCQKGLWWERTAKDMEYCYRCGQKIDRN